MCFHCMCFVHESSDVSVCTHRTHASCTVSAPHASALVPCKCSRALAHLMLPGKLSPHKQLECPSTIGSLQLIVPVLTNEVPAYILQWWTGGHAACNEVAPPRQKCNSTPSYYGRSRTSLCSRLDNVFINMRINSRLFTSRPSILVCFDFSSRKTLISLVNCVS